MEQPVHAESSVRSAGREDGQGGFSKGSDEEVPGYSQPWPAWPERAQSVDGQLRRLESRLLADAGGDRAGQEDVRRHLALVRSRFETATIRQFLPVLIEGEVRRRLSGG
jgi:hypothetical protein